MKSKTLGVHSSPSLDVSYTKDVLQQKLQQVFGYSHFRGKQLAIIQHVLSGKDAVVIMPTGAGKSLCYQLPALLKSGTALVISPLIALMKNQIDQLYSLGVSAYFLNSTLSRREIQTIKTEVKEGKVQLLYIAPESLGKKENIEFFKRFPISFVAVDETHCISEWGHDFRPEYRRIREVLSQIGQVPIIALTATATPKVQMDIQKNLDIKQARVFKSSFNRANLFYEVVAKQDSRKYLVGFLQKRIGQSGIVYCLTRKKVEEIAHTLCLNGIQAAPYHAGLDAKTRVQNQDAFLNEQLPVIVATVAFGMGINKMDVRFVVHYDVPKSLEGYYQETGRAGRDANPAHCLMLFSYHDIGKIEKFNKDKPLSERDSIRMLLEEVSAYAESPICRRGQLLLYFGEQYDQENCEHCDNCIRPTERFLAQKHLKIILEAVEQIQTQNSISYVVDVLVGKKSNNIRNCEHEKIPVFGIGAAEDRGFWSSLIRQAIYHGFLHRKIEFSTLFENLALSEKGRSFLASPHEVYLRRPHIYKKARSEKAEEGLERAVLNKNNGTIDSELLLQLIKLQKKIAKEAGIPPYIVFQENALEEMAVCYPTTTEDMLQIQGVGKGKMEKYGSPFLALIKKYVNIHNIQTSASLLMRSAGVQSRSKISIIRQIDKKIPLEEISACLGITLDGLLEEMENICYSGTQLNLSYHLDCLLDSDQQEEMYQYFLHSKTDDLHAAYEALSDYTEEEIRLMRIHFISELAY